MSVGAFMAVGGVLGLASTYYNQKEQTKMAREQLAQEKQGARIQDATIQASLDLMKEAANRDASDAMGEILRTGSSELREARLTVQAERSRLAAQSEGLTSGISKAKQMMAFDIKANKVLSQIDSKASSQISQMLQQKDQVMNELNNKKFASNAQLQSTLSKKVYTPSTMAMGLNMLSGGMSGAASMGSIYSSYKNG